MTRFLMVALIVTVSGCGSVPAAKGGSASLDQPGKMNKNGHDLGVTEKNKKDELEHISLEAQALLAKQHANFPRIIEELKTQKKKVSHWIWWVFPSEKAGDSEPSPKTKIELSDADYFLKYAEVDAWAEILEAMYELLKTHSKGPWKERSNIPNDAIIPAIDHGRIKFSLQFWLNKARDVSMRYPRLYKAFKQMEAFNW